MSKQVLFVQGAGQAAHDTWDDKLVLSLERELGAGYSVLYPRMPGEADPRYAAWKTALLHEFDKLEDGAIIIGHSVGGTVLVHALAEQTPKPSLGAILLIAAPFIGDGGWHSDDIEPRADIAERLPAGLPVFLYHGTADDDVPFEHLALYAKLIPQAVVRDLADRNHQLNNDLSDVARDIRSLGASGDLKSRPSLPRLRFDKVALRVVEGVREGLSGAVPNGACVVFTVTAPIRVPAKTVAAIVQTVQTMLPPGAGGPERAEAIHGNRVRVRIVKAAAEHAAKVAGFVHNPDSPPDVLLDLAQALAEGAADAGKPGRRPVASGARAAEHYETLQCVREQVLGPSV